MGNGASLSVAPDLLPKRAVILVVDDNEMNRDVLKRRLDRDGHEVLLAADGQEAIRILKNTPIDLVLLDIMMPVMDGYQALHIIKTDPSIRHIPVIVITALDELESAVRCIEQGAEDYVGKPFNHVLLRARVRACLDKKRLYDLEQEHTSAVKAHNLLLEDKVKQQVKEISSAQLAAIFSMSKLAESKDPETGEHLERMREYCVIISRQLAKTARYANSIATDFHDAIYSASPLHDIGKVGIPDSILLKPGKLTDEEWIIMKQHPLIGGETLRAVDRQYTGNAFIKTGIEIAECHHEKWNGTGYPHGLKGEQIPLSARILALGDVYDALTSKRCYKEAFSHEKSRQIIIAEAGSHFDPDVITAFLSCESEFTRIRKRFQDPTDQKVSS